MRAVRQFVAHNLLVPTSKVIRSQLKVKGLFLLLLLLLLECSMHLTMKQTVEKISYHQQLLG